MALFFSRRAYNATSNKFTNNPASVTRYVNITKRNADGSIRKGGIVNRDDWLGLVKNASDGGDEILIYVHGFNTSQIDMLKRLDKIQKGLSKQNFKGAVIAYDWPSDGTVLAYNSDRRDAKKTAPFLVCDGIIPILEMTNRPKVHIVAHSMGALVVLRAFSDFGNSASSLGSWKTNQVTFASADIDSAWLEQGAWGSLVLEQRSEGFTNYYSGKDRVLALSGGFVNGGRERAGQVGMPRPRVATHWDIYCNEQYLKHVPKSKQTRIKSHRWWFDDNGFYQDLALTFAGANAKSMPTRKPTNIDDLALLT